MQLLLIGYILGYIFEISNLPLVILIVSLMCAIAAKTATDRTSRLGSYNYGLSYISLWFSTFVVGTFVVVLIIAPQPWYSPRIVIPIFGMILGHCMNGVALSLERFYAGVRSEIAQIEALLSFGATPWEAVRERVKDALRAGMTPTINSLMVVGLVNLPGMMTGQVLGGIEPQLAARYQIVIMLSLAAGASISCLLLLLMSYKNVFNEDGAVSPAIFNKAAGK